MILFNMPDFSDIVPIIFQWKLCSCVISSMIIVTAPVIATAAAMLPPPPCNHSIILALSYKGLLFLNQMTRFVSLKEYLG
jgi:hypothetical protein